MRIKFMFELSPEESIEYKFRVRSVSFGAAQRDMVHERVDRILRAIGKSEEDREVEVE